MSTHKVPVLVSQYAENLFTAKVVDGPELDAAAMTSADAFEQIRSQLKRLSQRDPDQYWPRIDEFELCSCMVKVRMFYRDGKRQFPASREMKISVQYILGKYVDKSVECFLPDYDIAFHCPAIHELSQLIEEAVRGAVASMGSRELAAATPPPETKLRFVRVRLKEAAERDDVDRTAVLSVVSEPLVKRKRKHTNQLAIYRDKSIESLLAAMRQSSVLLVGEAGCGKTSIIRSAANQWESFARKVARLEDKPTPDPIAWSSSAENLIAGMQYLGEWEERLEKVIAELDAIDGVLVISSLVDLIRLGGSQPADSLASFLVPYLRRGELKLVVETTPDELEAARRLLPGLVECFQILPLDSLDRQQTTAIVNRTLQNASRNHRIEVETTVADAATRLFTQFMPYQAPPRAVLQLIDDMVQSKRREKDASIHVSDVIRWFTKRTGLPEPLVMDSQTLSEVALTEHFRGVVMGQPRAVSAAVNVVLRLKAGLCDPMRPVATMLFCGPTGVGKTQLARSLADYLFGKSNTTVPNIIRLDMSEYAQWDAVDRLLIAPDGEVSPWISQLRAKPMSVVLLDEFEKSSSEVHDCLLSALDEGRMTDRFGRTTTLCGSIVIMTSNVGSKSSAAVGFGGEDNGALQRAIHQEFRPEFLNRLDEVVIFDALSESAIQDIVRKELRELGQRETLRMRRVELQWDESVIKRLSAIGFDPLLGARPLQRAIEREVVSKIARRLLESDAARDVVRIDLKEMVTS